MRSILKQCLRPVDILLSTLSTLVTTIQVGTPAHADQFERQQVTIAGEIRTYFIHKPSTPATTPLPLVMVLHGGGGNGALLKDTYGFKPMIERGEFIAVYPNAVDGKWLTNDAEILFLETVVDEMFATGSVDPQQLFISGVSRGGIMTFYLLPRFRHKVRAAGTLISGMVKSIADEFRLPQPVDIAMINGTEDPLIPYEGGWGGVGKPKKSGDPEWRLLPVPEVANLLVQANGISTSPTFSTLGNADPQDGCSNEVQQWSDPSEGQRVMLVTVVGGGHVVPGGRQYLPKDLIGPACQDFDHAKVMWEFFQDSDSERYSNQTSYGRRKQTQVPIYQTYQPYRSHESCLIAILMTCGDVLPSSRVSSADLLSGNMIRVIDDADLES